MSAGKSAPPRYQEVARRLHAMLEAGELREGDRLPPERALAETFQVSRGCVREAVRTLAEKGLLESRHGDGTYVCASRPGQLAQALDAQRHRLRDILELRRVVEPGVAALAAQRATRKDIDALKILICDQQRALLEGGDDTGIDAAFHLALARITGNQALLAMLETLNDTLAETRQRHLRTTRRKADSPTFHLRIISALERKDAAAARRAMEEHLDAVQSELFPKEHPSC
jgi:GntR family transcriptional repressor for pyruvate dehydrogenase complex